MPRPVKARRVCGLPCTPDFGPLEGKSGNEPVFLSIDEYEVIRLIDYEGLNQQQASRQMNIARTTVQSIYSQGRRKLAEMLVESRNLIISGGNYRLCNGSGKCLNKTCKYKNQMMTQEAEVLEQLNSIISGENTEKKGRKSNMKIIVPVTKPDKTASISDTFGRTDFYLIYETENDDYQFIENPAKTNPGSAGIKAAQTIVDTGARILLTPRCGMKASKVLEAADFKIYQTVGDDLQENLEKYRNGDLEVLQETAPGKHGGR